ncbi:MAG: methyl-accepting chemotaxis protein [Pseudomonadota bacterium]
MKLSTRIFGGFGLVLAIALILTGASLYIMKGVAGQAHILSNQFMPQTHIASNVERVALGAVSAMDRFDSAYDESFLSASREHLKAVKKNLQDAEQLTTRFPELTVLKANTANASERLSEFETILDDTEKTGKEIHVIRKKLEASAENFMKPCIEFLDAHTEELSAGFKQTGVDPASLNELLEKIRNMSEVIQIGYVIQLDTGKGQLLKDPKIIEESAKKFVEIENILTATQKKTTNDTSISQLEDIRLAGSSYKTNMKKLIISYTALTELGKKRSETGKAVSVSAENTAVSGIDETLKSAANVERILNNSNKIILIGGIIGFLISLALIFIITRGITRPIGRIIEGLYDGANQVASAAGEVSASSQSLAEGTSEQAASIEETSSSLEEMSSMTKQNAENAQQADALMKAANQVVNQANLSMGDLTASMKSISRASEETSKIIKTIDEIAFQTNLLALNAAVEAARAGEAGAGFAVVADEVRNLAMRAATAAKDTATLIEDTVKEVKSGSGLVTKTSEALGAVAESALKVGELVGEIAAASHEQSEGIEQVNKAVAQMDKIIQQNAANAEESASASEELSAQAEQMKGYVEEMVVLVDGNRGRAIKTDARYTRTPMKLINGSVS